MGVSRVVLLLGLCVVFAAVGCLAQSVMPGNDVGVGGLIGNVSADPGSWQTNCQNVMPTKTYSLTFQYGWFNGLTDHPIIGVNGQFPGPLLLFEEGECVAITINNQLVNLLNTSVQYNSTVHFHGQHFHGATWSDGVPGVTQCLVPYGKSMTYYWQATAVGTSWYHGHYDGQYTSGLFGPYIVVPKQQSPYMTNADSEWIVHLSDGYANDYKTLINFVMSPQDYTGEEPLPDYLLLNGHQDGTLAFDATRGEKILIHLINSAALTMYKFSIDGIIMQVVEIDGSATQPFSVSDLTIHVAQRVTILVDLSLNDVSKLNAVWMRFDNTLMPTERLVRTYGAAIVFSGTTTAQYYRGRAITSKDYPSYSGTPTLPTTFQGKDVVQTSMGDWNLLDARPYFPLAAPAPDLVLPLLLNFNFGQDGTFYAYFNGITYNQMNHHNQYPTLYQLVDNVNSGAYELPLSFFNSNMSGGMVEAGMTSFQYTIPQGAVVDILINNTDTGSHPIHFHGYRFWMVDSDQNPNASMHDSYLQRDVATAAPLGWVRFRFVANNPGAWLLHCHIDWHFEEGLATIVTVDPLSFISNPNPPPAEHQQICAWWQDQENAAFAAAVTANTYTPTTTTIVTAASAAPWTFIANAIICVESVFALAIYKMGLMYSLLFDLVALNIGTLLGVCWIELEHGLWMKVYNGALTYEIVSFLIILGAMVPYVFEKFVKRGRANKFAWLKHTQGPQDPQTTKSEPTSVGSASDQPPSVAKPGEKTRAVTVTNPDRTDQPQTPRAAPALSVEDEEAGNLIRIHASSLQEDQKSGKPSDAGDTAEAKKQAEQDSVEMVPANSAAIASPSQAYSKAVQIPESTADQKKAGDVREGDGVTIDPTKHGEYKLAKAAAKEMDVILIIIMLGGDMLHNFVDGSIIASAFLTSNAIGLATSIGIFMEELPHLIGTFAVFVHAGAPIWKAVALSTFGAFPFILGGALIIGVASDTSVNRDQISYLLAFAIGSFLYITLADLVPVLTSQWNGYKRALIQTLCIGAGIGLQAGIAVYNVRQGEDAHPFTTASGGTFDPT